MNHLKSVLHRNNFEATFEQGNRLILKQSQKTTPLVKRYYMIAIVLVVIGVITIIFLSPLFGAIVLSGSYPIYARAKKLKGSNKSTTGRIISIDKDFIEIGSDSTEASKKIRTEEISKYSFSFDRDENLPTGKISIETNSGEQVDLIEFIGQEKNYVEEDLKAVLKEIKKIINK